MDDWFKDDFRSEVKTQLMSNIQIHFLGQYNGHCSGWAPASVQLQPLLTSWRRHAGLSTADQDRSWKAFLFSGCWRHRRLAGSMQWWILVCSGGPDGTWLMHLSAKKERAWLMSAAPSVKPARPPVPPGNGNPNACFQSRLCVVCVLFCFPSVIKEEWKC